MCVARWSLNVVAAAPQTPPSARTWRLRAHRPRANSGLKEPLVPKWSLHLGDPALCTQHPSQARQPACATGGPGTVLSPSMARCRFWPWHKLRAHLDGPPDDPGQTALHPGPIWGCWPSLCEDTQSPDSALCILPAVPSPATGVWLPGVFYAVCSQGQWRPSFPSSGA